ncbi:MAG TPA: hypothetical protein VKU00_13735 [Chthonomonadaceae bacterium]|nr:hypothetical protein [Chthonomonadaceae bacterium]
MQLKIKRSQRQGGLLGGKVLFGLDVLADYTAEEKANINKYNLGGEVIYNSQAAKQHLARMEQQIDKGAVGLLKGVGSLVLAGMNLNITIASLGRGHHIECKDLAELLEAEQTIIEACKSVRTYLQAAATFDGREILVDLDEQKPAA